MSEIDLVIPMVFPQDPEWQREYARCMGGGDATVSERFRSWGTEELLVRCVMKYMPWVRRIHLLLASESQVQPWMGELAVAQQDAQQERGQQDSRPEIRLVFHREFMPERVLPCFNVLTIEMFLHQIPGLSEHFIYSNDDFFPLSPLDPGDFFRRAAVAQQHTQLLPCQHHDEEPFPGRPNIFQRFVKNGLDMVAEDWGRRFPDTWLRGGHSMQPMLLSTVREVCRRHAARIAGSFTAERTAGNLNQYIFPFWQHLSGRYVDHVPRRRYVGPRTPTGDVAAIIRDPECGIVCVNDNEMIRDWRERARIVREEIGRKLRPL